ncbi:hypothetical protein Tco_0394267 [Tanacetum coccineum]
MDNLHKTEAELEIEFNKPLSDQDLILKLNDLARKKRKHPDDIHDYFRQDFVTIEDFGDFSNEIVSLKIWFPAFRGGLVADLVTTLKGVTFVSTQVSHAEDEVDNFKRCCTSHTFESKLEYKFQDQENSEDIFSSGSALEDVIYVVFVQDRNIGEIVGSVPEPFSLSVDLNIKSPKLKLAEDKFSFVSLKIVQLQLFRYLEDQGVSSLQFM